MANQVDVWRQEELKSLKKIAYLRAFMQAFLTAMPTGKLYFPDWMMIKVTNMLHLMKWLPLARF